MTRAQLHLYSEDGGETLHEARHGRRWGREVDAVLAGPMARSKTGKDYFVNEVALAVVDAQGSAVPVMIARWFRRSDEVVAKVHPLRLTPDKHQFVIDARPHKVVDVPLTSFLLNAEDLQQAHTQAEWGLPAPDKIHGASI